MSDNLEKWIENQREICKQRLRESISATHLIHVREAFSQTVRPVKGSVLASPVSAHWDPEPDYFYHWVRDSAIVMSSIVDLALTEKDKNEREVWAQTFIDYVSFSLTSLQTGNSSEGNPLLSSTREELHQYLRSNGELSQLNGDTLLKEPRFNPDGTPDLQNWARPQLDGPALRALACLKYLSYFSECKGTVANLLEKDLSFTLKHADSACIGPWEEDHQIDQHYFTSLCQLGALHHGKNYINGADKPILVLKTNLDKHWDDNAGYYRSLRSLPSMFDAGQFMAALHADLPYGSHSLQDTKLQSTVAAIESYFANVYEINKEKTVALIGRNPEDRYFGNNPWFPTCFSLAEYYYKKSKGTFDKGDAILTALRDYIPADGSLSEQFDRVNGQPVSAKHLTWSYAAFLSATHARQEALRTKPALGRV